MNNSEINDVRTINDFKIKSFSKYPRNKVKDELIKNLYNSKIEPSCYWSIELICAAHFQDLWEIISHFTCRYIHLGNPKLAMYIEIRFNNFKKIISNGYIGNELALRNNEKIRKLFAEIITILCQSRKKNAFESLSIKNKEEFYLINLTEKLRAPNINYAGSIYKPNDPKELFIPINEFIYELSKESKDSIRAAYWVEWIIQYESICKQKKNKCECERRSFIPVDDKFQMDIIWILWEILIIESKKKQVQFYEKTIMALLNLFCIRFTSACKRRRRFIMYCAINFLTETVNLQMPLMENRNLIESIAGKINIIYREIKKNEVSPQTDYLYLNVTKSNIDKTIEKLEKMDDLAKIEKTKYF